MINWLINSTLCSGMLLAFYHLVLKNTSLFKFNRLYLLMSLLIAFTAPLIVIHQHAASLPSIPALPSFPSVAATPHIELSSVQQPGVTNTINGHNHPTPVKKQIDYFLYGILIYGFIATLRLLRFLRNLYLIYGAARRGEKMRKGKNWLVLVDGALVPHTFLNRIFLNKQAYLENSIEQSVIDHEMAHATGYHSLDVIFIALLQAIFWFNPFLFLYRRAVQLNHEFIADAAAIKHAETISGYQQVLLSKISLRPGLSIASQFNYSITKKRLIMMTKHTSVKAAWLCRLAMMPVMAAAFLLFCSKTQAQQPIPVKSDSAAKSAHTAGLKNKPSVPPFAFGRPYPSTKEGISAAEMTDYVAYEKKYATRRLSFSQNMTTDDEKHLEQLYQRMSPEQQKDRAISFRYPPDPLEAGQVTRRQLESFKDPVQYGVWIDDKRIDNAILNDLDPKKFCILMFSRLTPRAVKNDHFHYQITLMTKAYYKKYAENAIANRNHSMIMFHLKS